MRFTDFLRAAIVLFAGAATALAVVALAAANAKEEDALPYVAVGWWVLAAAIGLWLGRGRAASTGIGRLLASAHSATALPELEPGTIVFNRLWALAAVTVVAGGIGFLVPQVPAVAVGYLVIVALVWRNQAAAVKAIEERDGVQFYVDRTSPFKPTRLVRVPGFRKFDAGPVPEDEARA